MKKSVKDASLASLGLVFSCFIGSSFFQLEARSFLKVALDAEFTEDLSHCANLSEPVLFLIKGAFL